MEKGGPQLIAEEKNTSDLAVVTASPDRWYQSEAKKFGFPDLLPDNTYEYSVAVGFNAEGKRVKAILLERYVRYPGAEGIMHRAVLREKAKAVFGLTGDPIPHPAE